MNVSDITREIIAREGGFVNDPNDPGGATNFGVTIHTMRRLGLDLDRDGDVDVADVRMLTRDQAADIFESRYLREPKIDQLPNDIIASVYDMQVNSGSNAVKILQRLLAAIGEEVGPIDGQIGPRTIAAAQRAANSMGGDMLESAYGIERRNYYYAIGDRRPQSRKYARRRDGGKGGWITRAEHFIAPKYHLTRAQHDQRVAAWA